MSVKISSAVWQQSRAKGTARLVLLAIADHCQDNGQGAYPSIESLAQKCALSPRAVQENIRSLQSIGELSVDFQAGPHGTNVYSVHLGGADVAGVRDVQGADKRREGVRQASPEPSTEPSVKSMTPTGSALPATNGRRDSAIAAKYLQRLEPVLASGSSFDLLHEFRELWEPAWQEAVDQGITPKSVGRNLLAAFIASVTDTDPDYGRAGQLVGRYGKLALLGIDEGLIANADDPYRYAHRVCSNQSAAHRSEV